MRSSVVPLSQIIGKIQALKEFTHQLSLKAASCGWRRKKTVPSVKSAEDLTTFPQIILLPHHNYRYKQNILK